MPKTHATDKRWLEHHGGKWRVTVAVPWDLHKTLGTRLKRSLHTDSLAVANSLKLRVVHELRARIEHEREVALGKPRAVIKEALQIATMYKAAADPEEVIEIRDAILEREAEILGPEVKEIVDPVRFEAAKKETRSRDVPMHPDLVEIIERRSRGKQPDDDLFPEWPHPRKADTKRERSFKASNAFTTYRRKCLDGGPIKEMRPLNPISAQSV